MKSRKPWVEKLRPDQKPKLVRNPRGKGKMLVPTPMLVAAEVRRARKGQLITPITIRERLAKKFKADVTCPLTTGIFLSIVAGAAEDDIAANRRVTAPYWRVVTEKRRLNPKFPPGEKRQAEHLRAEGHKVRRDNKGWYVEATRGTK